MFPFFDIFIVSDMGNERNFCQQSRAQTQASGKESGGYRTVTVRDCRVNSESTSISECESARGLQGASLSDRGNTLAAPK